jgi:two-component system, NarL family, invasion response regulator UvrY
MRILVIDDHAIVRGGLRRLLAASGDAEIVEAASAKEGLARFRAAPPGLVLLDLNLPDAGGLELLRRFRAEDAAVPVLVFSMHADAIFAVRALQAGAAGYVSKNAAPDELLEAVRRVAAGERYVEREIAQQVALLHAAAAPAHPLQQLTRRELEMLRLLGEGRSLQQIAEAVGVSYKTVANGCGQLKAKLGVARTTDLVRIAVEARGGAGALPPFDARGVSPPA